jgi:hypothetical protein
MNNNLPTNTLSLSQRKKLLELKLQQNKRLIQEDLHEIREDLKPLRTVGNLIGRMLKPAPEAQITNSPIMNFGLDTGISLLATRLVPGLHPNTAQVIIPILIKNLATHAGPPLKRGVVKFLEWVVKKTADPSPDVPNQEPAPTGK